jgi:hypothetical protein
LVSLTAVVRSLLQQEEVNEKYGLFGDVLAAAVSQGYEKIVEDLLQNGANPDTHGGFYMALLLLQQVTSTL